MAVVVGGVVVGGVVVGGVVVGGVVVGGGRTRAMSQLSDDPRLAALLDATARSPRRACRSRSSRRTCSASAFPSSPTARTRCARSCVGADRFGDRDCYVFGDGYRLPFDELIPQVASLATALRDRHGIGAGDRVAVCAANCREWLMTFWAVAALDAVLVAMNGWWTGAEMRNALDLTDPKLLVMDEKRRARLDGDPGVPRADHRTRLRRARSTTRRPTLPDVPIAEDDPFILIFTSGTTGRPKAAVLSHRSVISYLMEQSFIGARGMAMAGIRTAAAPPPSDSPTRRRPRCASRRTRCSTCRGCRWRCRRSCRAATTVWPLGRFDPGDGDLQLTQRGGHLGVGRRRPRTSCGCSQHPDIETIDAGAASAASASAAPPRRRT